QFNIMSDYDRRSFLKKSGGILGLSLAGFITPAVAKKIDRGMFKKQISPLSPQKVDEEGFISIYDGHSLDGWHVSAETVHSRASKHVTGGEWKIENGAIWGGQDLPGNGGIIITDKQDYGDFEIALEMKND